MFAGKMVPPEASSKGIAWYVDTTA